MNLAEQLLTTLPLVVIDDLKRLGITLSPDSELSVLSHGLSNQNYLIHDSDKKWVLRSNSLASNGLCDRQSEVTNWRLAAKESLAPALCYVSSDHAYFLSEYIEEEASWQWGELLSEHSTQPHIQGSSVWPNAEEKLLVLLLGLSKLTVPDNIISVSCQWQRYLGQLRDIHAGCLTEKSQDLRDQWFAHFHQLLGLETEISQWIEELNACALGSQYSHRDLNPRNLLYKDNQLFCIDFEYACGSHPLFDLAAVLSSHGLSTKQKEALTHAYLLGHPKLTSNAKSALSAAINIYWVFAACWSLLMAAGGSPVLDENSLVTDMNPNPHKDQEYLNYFESFLSSIG